MTQTPGRDMVTAPPSAWLGRGRGLARLTTRGRRRLVWELALVAAFVGIVLLLTLGPNKNAPVERLSSVPAQPAEHLVKAPLSDKARRVAIRFIQTAVSREHLDEAWTLVGPNLPAPPLVPTGALRAAAPVKLPIGQKSAESDFAEPTLRA